MAAPDLTEAERRAVQQVLESSVLSIGPSVEAFEAAICERLGVRHAVAVSSGTAGLHLGVIGAGIEAGDLVLTSSFSFVSSANAILYERAVPIFVDVDPLTGNLDPQQVAQCAEALACGGDAIRPWLPPKLRDRPVSGRLRAILPIHAFGQPAQMQPILEVANRHQLAVIEDACEALGTDYQGQPAGTLGQCGVFAFYPNKQITTGEGGMMVTNSAELAALYRSLRNQGRDVMGRWLEHNRLGYNYRLDEMSAALGVVQLQRLDTLLAGRDRIVAAYTQGLAGVDWLELPQPAAGATRVSWFVYVVRIKAPVERDTVMDRLEELGIPSRPYFAPIHLQPFYRERFGYDQGDFPVTEHLGRSCMALPFSSVMTLEQVERVCQTLRSLGQKYAWRASAPV